jgi:dTDP-4-dehydrorhamnose reductase
VTGASGFLGAQVARLAEGAGWLVTGTSFSSLLQPGLRLDLADADAIRALLRKERPDAVIHTAYVKDGPQLRDVIAAGSEVLASECTRLGARMVHVSSDVVFSGRAGRPYVEADPLDPITAYGEAKALAEKRVLAANPQAAVVRTSLLLGGRRSPGPHEAQASEPGKEFWSDAVRCPILVDDLAAALLEIVDTDHVGPLHVAGPDPLSRAALAELVTGAAVRARPAPPGVPLDSRLDCSLTRATLRTRLRGAREVLTGTR